MRFVMDGKFGHDGIDVVMFAGLITLHRLKRQDIQRVQIVSPFARGDSRQLFTSFSVMNRPKRRGVAVWTKSKWVWFFTPADPEAAVRALGIGHPR